jgi:hypothetical protein
MDNIDQHTVERTKDSFTLGTRSITVDLTDDPGIGGPQLKGMTVDFNGNAIGASPKAGPFQDLGSSSKSYTFWDDANLPALPSLPAAPSNFTVTAASSTENQLAWTNNATNAIHMVIERQKDGGSWVTWGYVNTTQDTVMDDQLDSASSYHYRIAARNAGGVSAFVSPGGPEVLFPDVPLDHWAYSQIAACVDAGIVAGYDDGLYHPEREVTRDQMAVYIARALAGGDASVPDFTDTPTFPDVPTGNWALKYVEFAVDQGVVTGYEDGSYQPTEQVNRAQMAVYIARAMVAPSGEAGLADYVPSDPRNFPDAPDTFWSYKHIEYCVEHGVVNGYEDGMYHPEIVVTRDQMAVFIARAFDLPMP